jgi:hypothetical protein
MSLWIGSASVAFYPGSRGAHIVSCATLSVYPKLLKIIIVDVVLRNGLEAGAFWIVALFVIAAKPSPNELIRHPSKPLCADLVPERLCQWTERFSSLSRPGSAQNRAG